MFWPPGLDFEGSGLVPAALLNLPLPIDASPRSWQCFVSLLLELIRRYDYCSECVTAILICDVYGDGRRGLIGHTIMCNLM